MLQSGNVKKMCLLKIHIQSNILVFPPKNELIFNIKQFCKSVLSSMNIRKNFLHKKKPCAIRRAFVPFSFGFRLVQMRSTENPSEAGRILLLNTIRCFRLTDTQVACRLEWQGLIASIYDKPLQKIKCDYSLNSLTRAPQTPHL